MAKIHNHLLKRYGDRSFVIQLKARFIAYCYLTVFLVILAAIIYSGAANLKNPLSEYTFRLTTLGPLAGGLAICILGLVIFVRGYFTLSAHFLMICGMATVWTIIFLEQTFLVSRLDTIVYIIALLAMMPIVILKRPFGMAVYAGINIILLFFFMTRFGGPLNLPIASIISYLADNSIAILAVTAISYQIYTINRRSLEKAEHDIQERKHAEEALRISERKARAILDQSFQFMGLMSVDGTLIDVNRSALELVGVPASEIINKPFWECPWWSHSTEIQGLLREAIKTAANGESVKFETANSATDGSLRYVDFSLRPFRDDDGDVLFLIPEGHDITERKQAEETLRKSEERYRTILNEMSEGYYEVNLTGNYTFYNEAFHNLFGYAKNEMTGSNYRCYAAEEAEAKKVYEVFNKIYKTEVPVQNHDWDIIRKDGERRTLQYFSAVVKDSENIPIGFRGIVRDITERKQAEAEKKKLQVQLLQAQKMQAIGTLAGGVAHDYNNMLGVILGHTEMALIQIAPDDPLHSRLSLIQQAARRSADITRQLLAFARRQTIEPRVLDLNHTVQGMLNLLRRLIGEDIDQAWEPCRTLCPVRMDPTQVDQILANLCVNARDAISGTGKITIETDNTVFDEDYCARHVGFLPGEYVMLAVSDNGCGMDSETRSHLFEPFFTTKEVGKGTGLGLATVYGIVKQNNGFINVYSEPGQGTTVKIYLPCHAAQTDQEPQITGPKTMVRGYETILLVEDEPMILEMTTTMLEELGYRVIPAPSPGKSIRLAKEHPGQIHLLMTDVVMPEMNGRDLAGRFTALYPDLKLLFMSGYTANVIAHQGVLDKGVAFLQKPFSMADLAEKLRGVLDEAKSPAQG